MLTENEIILLHTNAIFESEAARLDVILRTTPEKNHHLVTSGFERRVMSTTAESAGMIQVTRGQTKFVRSYVSVQWISA